MKNTIKPSMRSEWFSVLLIILVFASGFYLYSRFPEQVPSHWNMEGEVNGYSGRFGAAFFIPFMALGMYLMFLFLPYFDPKKEQYLKFASTYHLFKKVTIAFFFILYFLVSLNSLGHQINISFYVPAMIGILFVLIGFMIKKLKSNWFIGIRTPWTMSSETVWKKTSQLAFYLFIISGILMFAAALVPVSYKIPLFLLIIFLTAFAAPLASYFFYYQEMKKNKKKSE